MIRLPAHRYVPGFSLERVSPDFNNVDPLRRWLRSAPWAAQCGGGQLWRKVPVIVKVGWVQGCTQRVGKGGGAVQPEAAGDSIILGPQVTGRREASGCFSHALPVPDPVGHAGLRWAGVLATVMAWCGRD